MITKTKNIEQFIAYPRGRKTKKQGFFQLVRKNMIKSKKGERTRTLSIDVDKIVYGV